MQREFAPAVYMMASCHSGTIYTGVRSNLLQRVAQHRESTFGGFTAKYGVRILVWFEQHATMEHAIPREKQLKKWKRVWKLELIELANPDRRDVAPDFGFEASRKLDSRVRGNDEG